MTKIEKQVWEIIKEHPDELGFVLQEDNYEMYQDTYVGIGGKPEDAELTKEQFDLVKNYFEQKRG